jgi:hypothetical protein
MSLTAIPIIQAVQLPNAVAIQYPCPAAMQIIMRHVVFCNTTAGAVTVTAYIVPNGGSVTDAAKILDAFSIAAHTAYTSPEFSGVVLKSGDTIQCFASAATSVSMNASGIQQS